MLLVLISPLVAQGRPQSGITDSTAKAVSPLPAEYQVGAKLNDHHSVATKYDVTKIGDRGIGGGLNFYSLQREVALGRELSKEIESQSRLITDPAVTEYVNRVGQTIVRNSDAKVPFTIKVIDNDEVNAFALPGGFFYVNSGLLLAADNEAELAGVMAHEIAHVAARHATRTATRSELFNLASIPLIFVGGPAVYAVEQAAGLALPMSFLKFSRDAEREADLLGLEYEYVSGYDPAAFVQFFEKLGSDQKQKMGFLAKAFSTHPMTADRIKRAQEEIQEYLPPRNEYLVDTSEFQDVKARLTMLLNGRRLGGPHDPNRPTLHRREQPTLKTAGTNSNTDAPATTSPQTPDTQTTASTQDDEDRPTLKRRN